MESVPIQRVTIASDGGLRHGIGTLGCKIVDRHGNSHFPGSGPVDVGHFKLYQIGTWGPHGTNAAVCIASALLGHVSPV
jgi:hypothetical protein